MTTTRIQAAPSQAVSTPAANKDTNSQAPTIPAANTDASTLGTPGQAVCRQLKNTDELTERQIQEIAALIYDTSKTSFDLHVLADNVPALTIYGREGFIVVGTEGAYLATSDDQLCHHMIRGPRD